MSEELKHGDQMPIPFQQKTAARKDARGRARVQTVYVDKDGEYLAPVRTKTYEDSTEIRQIVERFEQFGIRPHMANTRLEFRDVSQFESTADAMRELKAFEEEFLRLPADLRKVFKNDPAAYLDAAHSDEKFNELLPQLEKLGYVEKAQEASGAPNQAGGEAPSGGEAEGAETSA